MLLTIILYTSAHNSIAITSKKIYLQTFFSCQYIHINLYYICDSFLDLQISDAYFRVS